MIRLALNLASLLVTAILLLFTIRRWVFLFAALLSPRRLKKNEALPQYSPSVLILVPVRNESCTLPGLALNLSTLNYPVNQMTVVFINDGSTDNSDVLLQSFTADRLNWHLLTLPYNMGKARALNAALEIFSQGDIIVVFDADERPQPAALQHLVLPFKDEDVGGVSGRRAVSNSQAGPAAGYTAIEGLVHQYITMRAKDRLQLAPALLGANCAYRRQALLHVNGFKPAALLEDTDLTVRLARAGWRTHFVADAVSYHQVPETVPGYWRQHTRWARGFNDVAQAQGIATLVDQRLPLVLRLELVAFALGYLDRAALVIAAALAALKQRWLVWPIAISLFTPLVQIVAALKISNQPASMWRQMVWVPLFFGLDAAMAIAGLWNAVRGAPRFWEERSQRQ